MAETLNVVETPKDTIFQVRINSEIKKEVSMQYGTKKASEVLKRITTSIKGLI